MGYVQTILSGQASQYPVVKLFENTLSYILIAMIVFSAAWPYIAALKRRIMSKRAEEKA
jgi:putative tricarboxylic transport membrane protein